MAQAVKGIHLRQDKGGRNLLNTQGSSGQDSRGETIEAEGGGCIESEKVGGMGTESMEFSLFW